MVVFASIGGTEEDVSQETISRRAAIRHMAALSLIASTLSCSEAYAQKGGPQALQGETKAAVMQAFRKAADKGKVMCLQHGHAPCNSFARWQEVLMLCFPAPA